MDYEFYDAARCEDTDDEFFEQSSLLCALELYEEYVANNPIPKPIPLIHEFNLYYALDHQEGCYMWKLHYPEAD